MNTKIILIILLSCLVTDYIFADNYKFNLDIDSWDIESEYKYDALSIKSHKLYTKKIKKKSFFLSENLKHKAIYLNITNHRGFSKIFLNGNLLDSVGTISQIDSFKLTYMVSIILPIKNQSFGTINSIEIINYSLTKVIPSSYSISTSKNTPFLIIVHDIMRMTLPISYSLLTILIIISYLLLKKYDEVKENKLLLISLILFSIYFFASGFNTEIFVLSHFYTLSKIISIFGWGSLTMFYAIKYSLWALKKICVFSFCIFGFLLLASIIYSLNNGTIKSSILVQIMIIALNTILIFIIFKKNTNRERILKKGIFISLLFNIICLIILVLTLLPVYGLTQTGVLSVIIAFYLNIFNNTKNIISDSNKFNLKLLDSMEKIKMDVEKRDTIISDLKSKNDDIEREKSLFFSTLSSNLRTPLNSIIGYSENLYSTDNLEEVHPIVTEIIIESDKIFQAINNIMDFSTRDFTNNDLQLKDFRMKEIFENTVYGSSLITAYRTQIEYISKKDSDKVLISGNPLIYKQITTSVLHFLIGLNPDKIEFTVSNSGITVDHMNLIVKFKATGLEISDFSIEESIRNNRNIFTKYIKLYGIKYSEEMNDCSYAIDFNFQCGLSKNIEIKSEDRTPLNLFLKKSLSVLVVEDYIPNLTIVKMHLIKMGCEVFTATDGEEAIVLFKKEHIDVILMDIKMPIMNGWEATERIRSTSKGLDTLIVGLTASSLDLDIRHCFESGMDDVQVKPIRKNQLYNKLNSFESFKPERFPSLASLRADYRLSKVETETLFSVSVKQIGKQLEMIEMLVSAEDDAGVEKEMPAIINASLTINAFYYSRLLRNFFDAYERKEQKRLMDLLEMLKETINKVKSDNAELFRN